MNGVFKIARSTGCGFHKDLKKVSDNHEDRIRELEIKESARDEKIDGLCEKINDLVKSIKWLIAAGATSLGSFFIWYIQSL